MRRGAGGGERGDGVDGGDGGRGFVDGHVTGWTELRVHGVAGTAPEAVLEHPTVARVAGDAQAGFFRRVWPARSIAADGPAGRTEVYSWGGLTSGDTSRALWLLLLPFMLLNVAFFAAPHRRAPADGEAGAGLDRFSAAVQRLLALSFTATFSLTTVTIAMDLVGWQCAAQGGGDVCGSSWLAWLAWGRLDHPGRQLAVTAVLPLATLGLLWWLARSTWNTMEAAEVTQLPSGTAPEIATPLEDRAMWNGRAAVRVLRVLHVGTGLVVPGVFVAAPLRAPAGLAVVGAALAFLALTAVLAALPGTGRRERPAPAAPDGRVARHAERDLYTGLPWFGLAITVVALVVAVAAPEAARTPSATLPGLVGAVQWLFVAQSVLLVLLLVACLLLRRRARPSTPSGDAAGRDGPGPRVVVRPAWRGLAMPGIAVLAWVLAGGLSGGVILRTAQTLGSPVVSGQPPVRGRALVVATAYYWAAVAALVLGVLALGCGLLAWWRARRSWPDERAAVEAAYGDVTRTDPDRRDAIATAWTVATRLPRRAQGGLGFVAAAAVAVVVLGAVGFLSFGPRLVTGAPALVDVANLALSGFVLVLLAIGRQAYRSAPFRRTVGIAWDLGTFWPRAVHPLAPPCYAERAVPDLMVRTRYATAHGEVLLSCHSQGSVLGAAVLLQVERAVSARTALLTYGSPLARLYGGFFPVYFNPAALDRLGGFLAAGPAPAAPAAPEENRSSWRWRNLYRRSDPIGGPVFRAREVPAHPAAAPAAPAVAVEGPAPDLDLVGGAPVEDAGRDDPGDVDRALLDPVFARPPGDPAYPPVLGHLGYLGDPVLVWTAAALRDGTLPRAAGPGRPAGAPRAAVPPAARSTTGSGGAYRASGPRWTG